MMATKLIDLPIPQSGCGNTRITSDGVTVAIEFEFRLHGRNMIGCIRFDGVVAYTFRNEMHSSGYVSEAYESLAEITESTWKQQMIAAAPRGVANAQTARHFAVFLSSNGYFEILANQYSLINPREGLLQ